MEDSTAAVLVGEPTGDQPDSYKLKVEHKLDKITKEHEKIGAQLQTISDFQNDMLPSITNAVTSGMIAAVPALIAAVQQAPTRQASTAPTRQAPMQQAQGKMTFEHYQGVLYGSFNAKEIKAYAQTKGISKKYCSSRKTVIEQLWLNSIPLPP